jgi:DNA (cytosine-5)-methyltransferase 1
MTAAALKALDLSCAAGGATRRLMQAGLDVTGVDVRPQPRYCADAFGQADDLENLATANMFRLDFIWASPPCRRFTSLKTAPGAKGDAHLDLIAPTRELLRNSRIPYAIENVVGAPLINPVVLCGTMFGLRTPNGAELRRHRLLEASFPFLTPPCTHGKGPVVGIYGAHVRDRRRPSGTNHKSDSNLPWAHAFIAMGVPVGSMTLTELSEAIPLATRDSSSRHLRSRLTPSRRLA